MVFSFNSNIENLDVYNKKWRRINFSCKQPTTFIKISTKRAYKKSTNASKSTKTIQLSWQTVHYFIPKWAT